MSEAPRKPLGIKNYGSIPHLPDSRMGPADHACHDGQRRIACEAPRDWRDVVIVTEKLDGSNCGIAKTQDGLVALNRAGYLAMTSPYVQHHMFASWVDDHRLRFLELLQPGERVVGEWLAQAHGSRYALPHGPFVAFDLMAGPERLPWQVAQTRFARHGVPTPKLISFGAPMSVQDALRRLGQGDHGCEAAPEGAVWRVERDGAFDFMVKFVRQSKIDGCFFSRDQRRRAGMELAAMRRRRHD